MFKKFKFLKFIVYPILLFSCNSAEYQEKEYIEELNKFKGVGLFDGERKVGMHRFYQDNGTLWETIVYSNLGSDSIRSWYFQDGKSVVEKWIRYSEDSIVEVFYYRNGDTAGYTNNGNGIIHFDDYYPHSAVGKVNAILSADPEVKYGKIINFDTLGNIVILRGELDYLTAEDSVELSEDYPDWEVKVRAWYQKKNPIPIIEIESIAPLFPR